MKTAKIVFTSLILISSFQLVAQPSAFGSGFNVQDFYKPFSIEDITPQNMQTWPYYKYVSANWDTYAIHGTTVVSKSNTPTNLTMGEPLDMNTEFKDGMSWIESHQSTQVKGFVVMKNNVILAEYYDNGFNVDQTNLLQSASKTFTAIVVHQLIENGLIDVNKRMDQYVSEFKDTDIGKATVEQVLDMVSGLPTLLDFKTLGAPGQLFEVEQGMQEGETIGHIKSIADTKAIANPGDEYNYSDKNTDALAYLAETVSKKKFPELLSQLFNDFGANYNGSISKTSDGTYSGAYGLSITARDYALFHQWIAEFKAPKSYYTAIRDISRNKIGENEVGRLLGNITYASQSYYIKDSHIVYSSGSYGQVGYSDLQSGVSVVFLQDWAVNAELDKFFTTREKAIQIINYLRNLESKGKH